MILLAKTVEELEEKDKELDDRLKDIEKLIFPKSPKIVEDEGDEFEEVSRPPKKKDLSRI